MDNNQLKYAFAKVIITKMLRQVLINQDEFERIDILNKNKFAV